MSDIEGPDSADLPKVMEWMKMVIYLFGNTNNILPRVYGHTILNAPNLIYFTKGGNYSVNTIL